MKLTSTAPIHASADSATVSELDRVEGALCSIWQDLLGNTEVNREDNFFDIGGNSLLAIQLIARLERDYALAATLLGVFTAPVLKDLASMILTAPSE